MGHEKGKRSNSVGTDGEGGERKKLDWEENKRIAIRVGLSISEYNDLMPSELMIHVEEYNRRKEIESDEAFALAYYNAAWQRSKKIPRLEKLLKDRENARKEQQPKRPQTAEEMLAMAMRLNAKNGGLTKGGGTDWQ